MRPVVRTSPSAIGDWLVANQGTVIAGGALSVLVVTTQLLPVLGVDPFGFFPLPGPVDSRPARVILAFVLFSIAVVAAAALLKLVESRRAATWLPATGRIVSSQEGFRTIRRAQGMPLNHRIADIVYEYTLTDRHGQTQSFRSGRISVAEEIPEEAVPGLLARYPLGAEVTVYFDPRDPRRALLERSDDDGRRTAQGLAALFAVLMVVALPAMWIATNFDGLMRGRQINGWAIGAAVLTLTAATLLAVFVRLWRDANAARVWPTVPGRIVLSTIEVYNDGSRRERNGISYVVSKYMPVIEYVYEVDDVRHVARNIRRDRRIGGSERHARSITARYPEGATVDVRYDPSNPKSATLELGLGASWSILAFGLAFAAGAAFAFTRV